LDRGSMPLFSHHNSHSNFSLLNKRSRAAAFLSPQPPHLQKTTPQPSPPSPAHKKPNSSDNNTSKMTTTKIQFAPSTAVEFEKDDPVSVLKVLTDAAERFPTEPKPNDPNAIPESVWNALLAGDDLIDDEDDDGDDDDDDDDESLQGDDNLRFLSTTTAATTTTNNNNHNHKRESMKRQSSESSLSLDEDASLRFIAPDFNEGFRMNSDQSLGLNSSVSSNASVGSEGSGRRMMGMSSLQQFGSSRSLESWTEEDDKVEATESSAS